MYKSLPDPLRAQAERMYKKYQLLIYFDILERMQCGREQAEDLTEQVFERACRSLKDGSGPTTSEKRWLLKIAERVCIKAKEKERRDKRNTLSLESPIFFDEKEILFVESIMDESCNTEEQVESRERRKVLREAIEKLPPNLRDAIILYYLDGLTYAEISVRLKKTPNTVMRYTKEGLQQLQEYLIQAGNERDNYEFK